MRGEPIPLGARNFHLHYCWAGQQFIVRNRAKALVQNLPIADGERVLVVGAGFGWLQEVLQALLPALTIVSIDSSAWVHSVKDTDEGAEFDQWLDAAGITDQAERDTWKARLMRLGPRAKVSVLNEDLSNGGSRNRVKSALGLSGNRKAEWGITEQVLPWLEDAEAQTLSANMRDICTNVAHVLTPFMETNKPEPPPLWNWKRIAQPGVPTRPDLVLQPWYTTTDWKSLLPDDLFVPVNSYKVF